MKKILFHILFLLLVAKTGIGQIKNITLLIDTLSLNECENFHIGFNPGFANLSEWIDYSNYEFSINYPNFSCKVPIGSDTTKIEIPIDNNGGYLVINQVSQLKSDTLKINKLSIIENCFSDTTFTRIEYYKVSKDGKIDKPYKVKQYKKVYESKCKNQPIKQMLFTINNVNYLVKLQKEHAMGVEFTSFHGGYPRRYLKDSSSYKKSYKYFYGQSINHHYINKGEIILKN
ncbi:MAG: hypothetical protein H6586_02205 [Flavobacteriales bacterium]|nr:hypothetical protein [Flavobacteriales bacterium]